MGYVACGRLVTLVGCEDGICGVWEVGDMGLWPIGEDGMCGVWEVGDIHVHVCRTL